VLAEDEATKEPVSDSEVITTFTVIALSAMTLQINVPVLEAVGQHDGLFCVGLLSCVNTSAVRSYEAPFYSPAAQLKMIVIPQAGHDLNLQKNAATVWYPQVVQWMKAHVS
jgi:hypothetical protein